MVLRESRPARTDALEAGFVWTGQELNLKFSTSIWCCRSGIGGCSCSFD